MTKLRTVIVPIYATLAVIFGVKRSNVKVTADGHIVPGSAVLVLLLAFLVNERSENE